MEKSERLPLDFYWTCNSPARQKRFGISNPNWPACLSYPIILFLPSLSHWMATVLFRLVSSARCGSNVVLESTFSVKCKSRPSSLIIKPYCLFGYV